MTAAPSPNLKTHYSVIVIGGGQAGLSMSWHLKTRGIDHVVFERDRIGESWRTRRWDSFCLVTPNWQCLLPGFPYSGPDPNGFMSKDEIVRYIEEYARSFAPPVREGVSVTRLSRTPTGDYQVDTDLGLFTCKQVVIATGGYQEASMPEMASKLPRKLTQIHSSDYKSSEQLPPGGVLVVGSGQSGCQIAEDLHLAGRKVHLCVGSAPRTARRYRGKDVVDWLHEMGYYDQPIDQHPQKERVRAKTNHYVTGRGGGRDIDLRKFALEGMRLYGRLLDVSGYVMKFADDLKANLDQADAVAENIKNGIDKFIAERGLDAPVEKRYTPVWEPVNPVLEMDYFVAGINSIVWCVGYYSDYRWVDLPIFDGKGYPGHDRGIVMTMPGVYFLGLPWQYTWGSGRFVGVARDAEYLAEQIAAGTSVVRTVDAWTVDEWALGS